MLFFSRPCDQGRLNATVFELVNMRFNGSVLIDGCWNSHDALSYLEARTRAGLIPTINDDGTLFRLSGKYIYFAPDCVLVTTVRDDLPLPT